VARLQGQAIGLLAKPLGLLLAGALLIALIVATRGLILLPVAAVVGTVIVRRRSQATRREVAAQEFAKHQYQLAEERQRREVAFAQERQRQELAFAQDLGRLLTLSASDFEHAVGTILAANGYTDVQQVGKTADRGADIICSDAYGQRIVVQCKRYGTGNKVTSGEMQGFLGAIRIHNGDEGIFVTTSVFTKEATSIAEDHDVIVIDGATLVEMARPTRPAAPARPMPRSWECPASGNTTAAPPPLLRAPAPPRIVTTLTTHGWTGREMGEAEAAKRGRMVIRGGWAIGDQADSGH
jgi:HJR/Mrr/RecB family endonuclease